MLENFKFIDFNTSLDSKLDEIASMTCLRRKTSADEKEGYVWDMMRACFSESDEVFRNRIKLSKGKINE